MERKERKGKRYLYGVTLTELTFANLEDGFCVVRKSSENS